MRRFTTRFIAQHTAQFSARVSLPPLDPSSALNPQYSSTNFRFSFIGEETSSNEKKIPDLTDAPTWIIDPIDGTINFCKTLPMTCISIALAVQKEIVIGIIYMPVTDEMYTAKRGKGAFLNGKPIHVSKETDVR